MNGSKIKENLHSGKCVFGTHIASLMNPMAAVMATEMNLDFAFFCTEHMPIDRTEVSMMCHLYAAKGISPMVRVPTCDEILIGMALDAGAQGIVVPYLETPDQALRAAGAVKYRPIKGKQLDDVLSGQKILSRKTSDYLRGFNRDNYLIIGVESVEAIRNLDALLDVPGVDGVFLGPHDITISMGIPTEYEHPDFINTVEDIIRRCRKKSVGVGLHYTLLKLGDATLQRFLDAGMNFILNGADIVVMRDAMNAQLDELRGRANNTSPPPQKVSVDSVKTCLV